MVVGTRTGSRAWLLASTLLVAIAALFVLPQAADAASCGREPGDDAALSALIASARAACPCDGTTRAAYRRCVRDVIKTAVRAGELPLRCRSSAARFATRSTCGARAGSVACCATAANGRATCTIARSAAACEASRRGTGTVGLSESCHDACAVPAATPTPTGPPTPTPVTGIGPRCICSCDAPPFPPPTVPYNPYGCPSFHHCAVMSFVPTGSADCDALDTEHRGCHYDPNAPPFYPDGPLHDVCTF